MTAVATFIGVVHEGLIRLAEPVALPEGSQVYVVVPAVVEERAARRKVNGWLVENVGYMLMADRGALTRLEGRPVWRFGAFVTSLSREPRGPIGDIDIDAVTGEVLANENMAAEIVRRGEQLERSPLSPEG
ncbi:MAG: PepSY domain-containing protein [Chloroflexi bacterium]|nr:PepSY domain-containing protein [Chloroflexota bacterium]